MSDLKTRVRLFIKRVSTYFILGVGSFALSTSIFANPVLDNVSHGNVTVQQTQTTTTVNQSSQKAIINWNSFNIGAGEHTHFNQPNGGVALNRISPTQGASQIWGQLSATGKIILVNPAGVFIGPSAFINVGSLIASTAGIRDENFLNGIYRFDQASLLNGAIVNQGTIIAAQNGMIALLGGAVSNEGYVQANMGKVVLASGEKFTMSFAGNDMISFTVDEGTLQRGVDANGNVLADGVKNTGRIVADGGQILLHAKAAAGVLDNAINMEGYIQAQSVYEKNGEIILSADPNATGIVRVAGTLDTSGTDAGESGGDISITGYNILLDSPSLLDARGNVAGGNIRVGGNYQGKGPLANANALVMANGARILADSANGTNGGEVILWSDTFTGVYGDLISSGGGLVETSGKQTLDVGDIQINAGNWLLDPYDITIGLANSDSDSLITSSSPFTPTSGTGFLSTLTLYTALSSGNVTIQTGVGTSGNGDIIITTPLTYISANSLLLSAYRNITSGVSGTVINNAGAGEVVLRADNTGTGIGTVLLSGNVVASGGVRIYYNPVFFGTQDAIYSGGTTPTKYMLVNGLGLANDVPSTVANSAFGRTLGSLSNAFNGFALWAAGNNYALAKDIDASATSAWNSGSGFRPIGNYNFVLSTGVTAHGTAFAGKFDGQGYVISNLHINQPDLQTIGMFGRLAATADVRNLGLTNLSINFNSGSATPEPETDSIPLGTDRYIGAIAAYVDSGATISNVYANGTITYLGEASNVVIGGLVGQSAGSLSFAESNSYINASTNNGITANSFTIGGIAGKTTGGTISNTLSLGNILTSGSITSQTLGGIVGDNAGILSKNVSVGGIFSSAGNKGGLVGINTGTVNTNNYWNTETSGQGSSAGGGTARTTSQMQNAGNMTGLDFTNDWNIISGSSLPYLRFMHANTPRAILGSTPEAANGNSSIQIAVNGTNTFHTRTYANGVFYLLLKNGELANSSNLLFYLDNANTTSNLVAIAPTANGSLTGLAMTQNTLTLAGSTPLTHAHIAAAKGLLTDTDIFYSVASDDLTLDANKNFASLAGSTYQPEGDVITSGTGSFDIAGSLALATNAIFTTSGTGSISGNISGSSSFTKAGNGTITLSGSNTLFDGATIIVNGTLALGSSNSLINSSGISINNNAILQAISDLSLSPAISIGTGGGTIAATSGTDFTISGGVTGANALSMTGLGNIILDSNVSVASVTSDVSTVTTDAATVTTTGTQEYTSNVVLTAGFTIDATDAIIDGDISGGGTLTKSGSGTLTLNGDNSARTGSTTVNAGNTLSVSSASNVGGSTSGVTLNNATLKTTGTINLGALQGITLGTGGGTIDVSADTTLSIASNIIGTSLSKIGAGTLTLSGSSSNYSGGTTLSVGNISVGGNNALGTGALIFASGNTSNLIITGTRTLTNSITLTGNGKIDATGATLTLQTGSITGAGNLTLGAGNITLAGSNTYTGQTITENGSNVTLTHANALGNGSTNSSLLKIVSGATVTLSNITLASTLPVSLEGGTLKGSGTSTMNGSNNITLTAASTIMKSDSGTFTVGRPIDNGGFLLNTDVTTGTITLNGAITGTGGITKTNSGTLTLGSASNTFSGGLNVNGGLVSIADAGALGSATNAISFNGGTLQSTAGLSTGSTRTITLNGNGTITSNSGTLVIDSAINGASGGTGVLTLNGAGGLTLSNSIGTNFAINTFTASSALLLGADVAINTSGNATFSSTVNSSGANRALTVNSGGTTAFNSTVGGTTPLSSLTIGNTGTTTLGGNITTTGNQTYGNALSMSTARTLTGNVITFNNNVTVTGNNLFTVSGTTSLGTNNVTMSGYQFSLGAISWNSTAALTLTGTNYLFLNSGITAPSGSITLTSPTIKFNADNTNTTGVAVDVGGFSITQGNWVQKAASLPGFSAENNFSITGTGTFLRSFSTAGGTSAVDSYVIKDIYGLQGAASQAMNKFYKLGQDIDASVTRNWNSGQGFVPIGNATTKFTGTIDGAGTYYHIIENLYINRPSTNNIGLIGFADGAATIKNTALVNANITGNTSVGIVLGRTLWSSTAPGVTITNVYTTGSVTGNLNVGGIAGNLEAGTIQTTYNAASVYGVDTVGGIVGYMENGSPAQYSLISNVYNIGSVTGVNNVGGLVGWGKRTGNSGTVKVEKSYNAGLVVGITNVGGLMGGGDNSFKMDYTNVYWDTQTSNQPNATGGVLLNTGSVTGGLNTNQAMSNGNYSNFLISTGPTTSAPNTWFMINSYTRPMLMMEHSIYIRNAHQLQLMNAATSSSYTLLNDIDMSATQGTKDVWRPTETFLTAGEQENFLFAGSYGGFYPIGNRSVNFTGQLDGNNFSINNINIMSRDGSNDVGIFGKTNGATLENIYINNPVIYHRVDGASASASTGVLVGHAINTQISNINISEAFQVYSLHDGGVTYSAKFGYIGGIVGQLQGGNLSNSFADTFIFTIDPMQDYREISGSSPKDWGDHDINVSAGSAVGYNNAGTIDSVAGGGTIYITSGSNNQIGGFVGTNSGTISNAYSTANITMSSFVNLDNASVGGFVSSNTGTGVITNSYATGELLTNQAPTFGGFAATNAGSINTTNFWDVETTGISTSAAGTPKTTAQLLDFSTYSAWSTAITSTASATNTKPSEKWFIFDENTRPMLLSAWSADIRTPYQLQLAGTTLGADYTLIHDIDFFQSMRNKADVWATNLTDGGGRGFVPIGYSTITDASAITNAATLNDFTGTFNGNDRTIENLYINRPVNIHTVGLFGQISGDADIHNVSISDASIAGSSVVGILVGNIIGNGTKNISHIYVSGDVSSNQFDGNYLGLGGLIGAASLTGGSLAISHAYSTAYVYNNGAQTAGGLIGYAGASTGSIAVTGTYSSGRVTGSVGFGTNAGFVGTIGDNTTITNSLWDTVTSNQAYGYNSIGTNSSTTNLLGGCFGGTTNCNIQPLNANNSTAVDLSLMSTYVNAGWSEYSGTNGSITSTPVASSISPNHTWFMFDGYTRPMLMSEWRTTINTAHQLQLMGAVLDGVYTLGKHINITKTLSNPGEIWSTNQNTSINAGFVPIGTNSFSNTVEGTEFTGEFYGNGKSIQNLYINRPDTLTSVGLFGATANSVTITELSLTNSSITGGSVTGGLIGNMISNMNYAPIRIDNIYVAGTVSGYNATAYSGIGGLIGRFDVTASNVTGDKTIQNSYSTATIASDGTSHNAGGFVGYLSSANSYIQYTYSTGLVSASGANVGGFVGVLNAGTVSGSLWDTVTSNQTKGYGTLGGSGAFSNFIGGCFGGTTGCDIQPTNATNTTAADLSLMSTYTSNAGWSAQLNAINDWPSINHIKPQFTWYMSQGFLRPMLLSEWSSEVSTTHQVQLMGAAQKGIYIIQNYIDFNNGSMNNAAEVWATDRNANIGQGFYSLGRTPSWCYGCGEAGFVDGQNFTIDNLYMDWLYEIPTGTNTGDSIGFFGGAFHDPVIQNITLANIDFNLEWNAADSNGFISFGGLFGDLNSRGAVVRNTFTTGTLNLTTNSDGMFAGGLNAKNYGTTVYNSGSSVDVNVALKASSNMWVGGFIGDMANNSVVYNSYATGNVSVTSSSGGSFRVAGFAGSAPSELIFNSYSSGQIYSTGSKSGFIADCSGTCPTNNNFWDTTTSGITSGSGATGLTTENMMKLSSFSAWDITGTPSETANTPANTWFIFEGSTRPMLMSEWSASVATPHQLQMIGVAPKANYTLENDIDLKTAMNNPSDVWGTNQLLSSGNGFVSIGTNANPFTGSFNGQGFTINNLYINRSNSSSNTPAPAAISLGLFGYIGAPAVIQDLGLTNVDINYLTTTTNITSVHVGAIAGYADTESLIRNVYAMGNISVYGNFGEAIVGGIIGGNLGVIQSAYSGVDITTTAINSSKLVTGGVAGINYNPSGSITNAYSTGRVIANGNATTMYTGGFAGENQSNISLSYSSGRVLSSGGDIGGFLGHATSGNVLYSLWDTDTSGLDNSAAGTGKTTAEMMLKQTYVDAGWVSITNSPEQSPTKPATDWFIFEGSTRPILLSEWSNSISTPHQLQLIGSTLSATYTLNNPVNLNDAMTNASDIWGTNYNSNVGSGFVSIGTESLAFTGILDGRGLAVNNLYMNKSTGVLGLFGYTATGSTIKNLGVINADLQYTNNILENNVYAGLLAGSAASGAIIQNVYTTGSIALAGLYNDIYIGGTTGVSGGTILNTYSNVDIDVDGNAGGNIYAGGLVGQFNASGSMSNSYSLGEVDVNASATNKHIGGLVGANAGAITKTYSTGKVINAGSGTTLIGGLAGSSSTNITASLFDMNISEQGSSAGGAGVTGKSTADLLDINTYDLLLWSITATPNTESFTPDAVWFIFQGETRPMLLSEWSNTISTPHQLQLMGAALGANYKLANDIDLTSSMNKKSEIWASKQSTDEGKGFVPIGSTTKTFTGNFNGNNFTINDLYINRSSEQYVGLFGYLNPTYFRSIKNINLTNIDMSVGYRGGGLVAHPSYYAIDNVVVTGNITGNNSTTGGIAGKIINYTSITNAYSGVNITGIDYVGGIAGSMTTNSNVSNSYSTGSLSGGSFVGGITGWSDTGSTVQYSYSSAHIAGTGSYVGAFIGYSFGNRINNFVDMNAAGISTIAAGNTSGILAGCMTGIGCTVGSANLSSAETYAAYDWDISNTPSPTSAKPAGTWFIFEGGTRPMLSIEWSNTISNAHQLQLMGSTLGADYTISKNFDMNSFMDNISEVWGTNRGTSYGGTGTTSGKGFVPIGTSATPFTGSLDAMSYGIDNLYINRSNETLYGDIGLFGGLGTPTVIENLALTNVNINYGAGSIAEANVGTIAGYVGSGATLINILVDGSFNISGTSGTTILNIGGLVGKLDGRLLDSYNAIPINITATSVPTLNVGGLVGYVASNGSISESYTTGYITATGTVTTDSNYGGIAGVLDGTITNSYSTRLITGPTAGLSPIGGISAAGSGSATDTFWDMGTTGITSSAHGIGKSTTQMFDADTYSAWDLVNTWNIVDEQSYPFFRALYPDTPQFVSGNSTASAGDTITLLANGDVVASTTAQNNGFYYFLLANNTFSGGESLLAYVNNGAVRGNVVSLAPGSNGSLSGTSSALNIETNTVTVGGNGVLTFNHGLMDAALPDSSTADILYSLDAGALYIGSTGNDITFHVGTNTTYNVTNNLFLAGTGTPVADFDGVMNFSGAGLLLSSSGAGTFNFNNAANINTLLTITGTTNFADALNITGTTVAINGNSNANGVTTLLNATLAISGLGVFADLVDMDNATLTVNGTGQSTLVDATLANLSTISIADYITTSGTVSLDNSTLDINGSNNSTLGGTINLTNNTNIDISGNNTSFTGTITNNNSEINLHNSTTFTGDSTLTITNGGTLTTYTTANGYFNGITNINNGAMNLSNSGTFNTLNVLNNGTLDIAASGTFGGTSTISAGGSVDVTGIGTFTGITNVDGGTLAVTGNTSFTNDVNASNGGIINLLNTGSVNAFNSPVSLTGTNTIMTIAGARSIANTLDVDDGATLDLQGASATTFAGAVGVAGGTMNTGGNGTFNSTLDITSGGDVDITGNGLFQQATSLNNSTLTIGGSATFNNLLSLTAGSHIAITGTTAVNHSLVFADSTAALGSDVSFAIPLTFSGATLTVNGNGTFTNTVDLTNTNVTFAGTGLFSDTVTLNNSGLTFGNNATFNGNVNLTGAAPSLTGTNTSTNAFIFNNPVTFNATNASLNSNGTLANAFTFNDTVSAAGNITLGGSNSGFKVMNFNHLVTLTGNTGINVTASGVKTFDIKNGVAGNYNLSIGGTGAGSYTYFLDGALTIKQLNIAAASGATTNLLDVKSNNLLTWNINGVNSGTITGLSSNTSGTFSNINNIVGGASGNHFIFANAGRISGVLDGRSRVTDSIVNRLDFSRLLTQLDVNFSDTSRISAGTVSNRVLGFITRFRAINDIIHTPAVSNGLITLANTINRVVITAANAGYINNPIQFSNFQRINSTSGQDIVEFQSFSLVNPATGKSIMPTATMSFFGFSDDAFTGNITKTDAVADGVNATQIRYVNDEGVDMLTDVARGNLEKLVKEQSEIVDQILDETKVGTGAACGA